MPENGGFYDRQVAEGKAAKAGTRCPYKNGEIGARCAWLAGHYDAHGYTAWDLARQTADGGEGEEQ